MNDNGRETLRMVTQNDPSLIEVVIFDNNNSYHRVNNSEFHSGEFHSDNSDDYSTLGAAIANNTHLPKLRVLLSDDLALDETNKEFYDGLKSNSSISILYLMGNSRFVAGGIVQEILDVYQENNSHLTDLSINTANLQSGGDRVIAGTLRSCRNLQRVHLINCNITDARLLPILDAVRGHRMLEDLALDDNHIGNAGCDAIAALLTDPNCNLRTLNLVANTFDNEGAITIANSLTNNTKLKYLEIDSWRIDVDVDDAFSNMLCNTSSINDIYSSNHTLEILSLGYDDDEEENWQHLASLLNMNRSANKSHVAINKILKFYPNIDMEPLFQWDAEGEQTLKALPHIINWFEGARIAVAVAADDEEFDIKGRKLSAIFQFAKAMPILFVPASSNSKVDNKKRKRSEE